MSGISLNLRVQPRAVRNEVVGMAGGVLRVRVTAPPEGGRANQAVMKLLAERLGVPKSSIRIVRGLTYRSKVVHVPLTWAQVQERLGI